MASHSSVFAWRIPQTEEPGRLVHVLPRVGHNLVTPPPPPRAECVPNDEGLLVLGFPLCELLSKSYCCCSVAKSGLTLCDPMDCTTPGFPVLHYLLPVPGTNSTNSSHQV